MDGELFRAKVSFFVAMKGKLVKVRKGDVAHEKSTVMVGREHLFEPIEVRFKRPVGRPASKAKASDDEK